MSCEHEHSTGRGGHHVAPITTFESQLLLSLIDLPHCTALNMKNSSESLMKIFRRREERYFIRPSIISDADAQLIINIPFIEGNTKIFSLILRSNGTSKCPKRILLFKNDEGIDFENVKHKRVAHEIIHPQVGVQEEDEKVKEVVNEKEFVEHFLPRHIFVGLHQITIFIESVHETEEGDLDQSELHYIELRGEHCALKKTPLIAVYELAPNPLDHKNVYYKDYLRSSFCS